MKKISEGGYEDVKRSDILKIEMFLKISESLLLELDGTTIEIWNGKYPYTEMNANGVEFRVGNNKFIKHMIGRTVGEAIDWIKTKSN